MDLSAWVAYTFIAALVMAAAIAHYAWREPTGTRRAFLGVLRGGALALIILLLFDPVVPTGADAGGGMVALVDGSLSMSLVGEGGTRWVEAREVVAGLDADRIQLFGAGQSRAVTDLEAVEPTSAATRLAPALRAALEGGSARVVVVTDGALEDAPEVRRLVAGAGVPVDFRVVGGETRANLGLESLTAPAWVEEGEEATVVATLGRVGEERDALGDTASVTLLRDGREVARTKVPVPVAGRTSTAELRFRPEAGFEGLVRLDVRVVPGGEMADDDLRSVYLRVAELPTGVAVVSFSPGQEPRFLLPALERALGLPVRGWLGLPGDRFLRIGAGSEAGTSSPVGAVRRAVGDAGLLVLHGMSADAPEWAREALREAERVLVLPTDPPPELPLAIGSMRTGDWYLDPDLPSSPVAPLLAGIEPSGLPPLQGLRPVELPPGYWAPLMAHLGRRGEAYPILAAGRSERQRLAVALGTGYWRWAFAGEDGREVYERLWAAVAGWLMEDVEGLGREAIRPISRVVERGAPIRWAVAEADSVRIVLEPLGGPKPTGGAEAPGAADAVGGSLTRDTIVEIDGGRAVTGPLPPGHYRYRARTASGDAASGELTVESYSPELLHPVRPLEIGGEEGAVGRTGEGRPLHTSPWPYILVVALLCVEWVLRRRWGLR